MTATAHSLAGRVRHLEDVVALQAQAIASLQQQVERLSRTAGDPAHPGASTGAGPAPGFDGPEPTWHAFDVPAGQLPRGV